MAVFSAFEIELHRTVAVGRPWPAVLVGNLFHYGGVYLTIPMLNLSCIFTVLNTLVMFVPQFLAESCLIA